MSNTEDDNFGDGWDDDEDLDFDDSETGSESEPPAASAEATLYGQLLGLLLPIHLHHR